MSETPLVDHYEVLQLSQNADSDTLERVFRLMAKRYHPDNPDSGNEDTFREVHEAYEVLTDPARRAAFDVQYDKHKSMQWQVFDQEAKVKSVHAGLECAIIGNKYEGMDMISFGPDLRDPHSPNEGLHIPSLGKVWQFMVALLESYGNK